MKFAMLGTDSESLALAKAAEMAGYQVDSELADQWETLLDNNVADGVIVARDPALGDLRGQQVIQLIRSGMPVLASFPLVESVLTYYEIDMAQGESNAVLMHFNPLAEQGPVIETCAEWVRDGHPELGAIEQIVLERPLGVRTQANVLWHFSRDVELLSLVAGPLNRLGALGSPDEAATYAGLSVQLLGKSEVPVRWEVGPVEGAANPLLMLIAQQGKLCVKFDESGQALELIVSRDGKSETTPITGASAAQQIVDRFALAIQEGNSGASTWPRALQAMELTDTIEISLRRGRMIEVHQQQLTEQMAFKGRMSALGCGVLLVIPPVLLLCGWLAELLGLPVAKYWPHVALVLLALFLVVQLIPKLMFSSEAKAAPAVDSDD